MDIVTASILGLIQGIGEFLPISSSAHLIIASNFMNGKSIPLPFMVALHLGTLGAVLIYFWRDWLSIGTNVILKVSGKPYDQNAVKLFQMLIIGSIPAGIFGVLFKKFIEEHLHHPLVVVAPLIVVGIILYLIDKKWKGDLSVSSLDFKNALFIGFMQSFALLPGVSRSGATIIGGLLLGMSRPEAARFSFLLGTPLMIGAGLLEIKGIAESGSDPAFIIGVLVSFVSGCISIKFLLAYLKRFGFGVFAIYRIAIALWVMGVSFS